MKPLNNQQQNCCFAKTFLNARGHVKVQLVVIVHKIKSTC